MDFLAATHNEKKKQELVRILSALNIEIKSAADLAIPLSDVEETGTTFEENALLKGRAGCKESGLPCIADDSGLCVDALDGAPGVYSARYAGEHGNDDANNKKLLTALAGLPKAKRTAQFVSVVCCVFPDGRELVTRGECKGYIAEGPAGASGFGYDPIFVPLAQDGRHMAQLTAQEKDAISHRGAALQQLAERLRELL